MSLVLDRAAPPKPSMTAPLSTARSASRRRPWWQLALVSLTLVVGGILGVTPDGTGFLQRLDARVSLATRIFDAHGSIVLLVTSSGIGVLIALTASAAVGWAAGPWRPRLLPTVAALVATAGAAGIAMVVRRPSPGHIGQLAAANSTSYPSIGAAAAVAVFVASLPLLRSRRATRATYLVLVGAAGASIALRLATGQSWPLDELAGTLLGVVVGRAVAPTIGSNRLRRLRPVSPKVFRVVAISAAVCCVPIAVSYASIIRAPGAATLDQRTVEWFRDHSAGPLVDRVESWWLWRHLPSTTAIITALPHPPISIAAVGAESQLPIPVAGPFESTIAGEGQWAIAAADPAGHLQIATTTFRPDLAHPSLVAAVAWFNTATTRMTLVAGTRQPGGGPGPDGGHVPASALRSLLAAFNSGYKMQDTPGGALVEGRRTRTMVNGLATLAITADGTATVGEWGTDLQADHGYTGLRQNLHLLVSAGVVVNGVSTNAGGRWGTVRNTLPTWRSGLGVTDAGDLVYVAGNNLTLGVLAEALVRAGAQRAMELDIHRGMVTLNLFTHEPGPIGHRLLPDMTRSADRYLTTDWRDFIMVTSR